MLRTANGSLQVGREPDPRPVTPPRGRRDVLFCRRLGLPAAEFRIGLVRWNVLLPGWCSAPEKFAEYRRLFLRHGRSLHAISVPGLICEMPIEASGILTSAVQMWFLASTRVACAKPEFQDAS
jgi:hypothetical protein